VDSNVLQSQDKFLQDFLLLTYAQLDAKKVIAVSTKPQSASLLVVVYLNALLVQ
jgi:hypothetical protein